MRVGVAVAGELVVRVPVSDGVGVTVAGGAGEAGGDEEDEDAQGDDDEDGDCDGAESADMGEDGVAASDGDGDGDGVANGVEDGDEDGSADMEGDGVGFGDGDRVGSVHVPLLTYVANPGQCSTWHAFPEEELNRHAFGWELELEYENLSHFPQPRTASQYSKQDCTSGCVLQTRVPSRSEHRVSEASL